MFKFIKRLIKKIIKKCFPSLIKKLYQIEETRDIVGNTRDIVGNTRDIVGETRDITGELKQSFNSLVDSDFQFTRLRRMLSEVEYYQPAYMIGGIDINPKRECKDRCRIIEKQLVPCVAGLKILDIGSSLGYICYYFADRGAVTTGWDSNPKNVEVARLIGKINGIASDFKTKELFIETFDTVNTDEFDVVIILSVLHHIIYNNGMQYAQELIKKIIEKVPILIIELALKNEDESLYWNDSLPENELAIFELVLSDTIIEKLGEFPTHLSSKQRPLYKITRKNNSIMVNGKSYFYDYKTNFAYNNSEFPYLHPDLRRNYYFSKNYIIKEYFIEIWKDNIKQIINEINNLLLLSGIQNIKATKLIDFEIGNRYAVVVITRDEGDLISDIIEKSEIDPETVANDILKFLAILEDKNYYHNDIRSWNTLWNGKNAQVIDYGMMSPFVIDDDIISLLRLLDSIYMKCKESCTHGNKSLPSQNNFTTPYLLKLYEIVAAGERSPKKILEQLRKETVL